jgi:hypothetical protein
MTLTREYFKIRFPAKAGTCWEWHRSNNGTDTWPTLAKVRAILTRGIQSGYHGRISTPFTDFEVVLFTERVEVTQEIVSGAALGQ